MKVLVMGGTGMLGHKLVQQLSPQFEVYTTIRPRFDEVVRFKIFDRDRTVDQIDLADENQIKSAIDKIRPDAVIDAAGVIKQIPSSKDVITTLTINSILPHRLASLSAEFGYRLIVVSTDCVFSGEKGNYTENDTPDATDLYGKSKNLGEVSEVSCLTLRTSIIGRELSTNHSLIEWFLSNHGKSVKGFSRAIYSGFPTIVFADIISFLLSQNPDLSGLYHVSSQAIDKFRLLSIVNDKFRAKVEIAEDNSFVIDRSLDSTSFRAATGYVAPDWNEMIERMALDPTPYDLYRK